MIKEGRLSLGNLNDAKKLAFLRVVITRWTDVSALVQAGEQAAASMLNQDDIARSRLCVFVESRQTAGRKPHSERRG